MCIRDRPLSPCLGRATKFAPGKVAWGAGAPAAKTKDATPKGGARLPSRPRARRTPVALRSALFAAGGFLGFS
eukprot:6058226-Alexandrium_andersonii.AAC.1